MGTIVILHSNVNTPSLILTSCEQWKQLFDTYSVNTPQAVNNGNNCLILYSVNTPQAVNNGNNCLILTV